MGGMSQPEKQQPNNSPATPPTPTQRMANLVSLAKRRGFVYPASEIYGGLNGFWDFGPLGVQLKNNVRDTWWHDMVECPPLGPDGKPLSILGLDSAIIQNPQTWVASGHVGGFADQMTDCRETKNRYRADHVICVWVSGEKGGEEVKVGFFSSLDGDEAEEKIRTKAQKALRKMGGGKLVPIMMDQARPFTDLTAEARTLLIGPDAENPGTLTEPRAFNLMFETFVGVFQSADTKAYLRPETAQGIFLNYKNILDTSRVKVPFGVAQVGKAFRNEVTPRNFIFRTREFEQMEMEFFCAPEESHQWYEFWVQTRLKWWEERIGLSKAKLQRREHGKDELSHYSTACADVEFQYPFTEPKFGELEGIAHRGNFDLTQHQTHSKTNLEYFDQEGGNRRFLPHVIEPASGLTRGVLAVLCDAYRYDESRASPEWLKIAPHLAPIKAGIFPLVNKDGMPEMAEKIYLELRQNFTSQYDAKQSIGKRYARMDEAGTPFCITVDGDSLKDGTVTVRSRDTASQERVSATKLREYLTEKLV
jgi:glycyl-tRNA synthetase